MSPHRADEGSQLGEAVLADLRDLGPHRPYEGSRLGQGSPLPRLSPVLNVYAGVLDMAWGATVGNYARWRFYEHGPQPGEHRVGTNCNGSWWMPTHPVDC
jgi:hypothetical protein